MNSNTFSFLFLLIFFSSMVLFGQQKEWEEQNKREKEEWEELNRREKERWEQMNREERQRWQDMVDRESAKWQAHVEAVKKKWREMIFSDVRTWVGYSDDKESRFKVDFDNGNLTIELLDERDASPDELRKRGMNMLDDLLGEKAAEDQDPILNNQLPRDVTPQKMPADYTTTEPYISPEGKRYHKMLINIPFREDHLRIRAQRYVPIVQRLCQKYDIHPKLVMAMIHTESSFNPKAISTFRRSNGQIGHAYGLMQLVPYSGGREAYEFVGGRGEPSPGLLFDPESNIELGIAYLYKLKRHYFVTVNDDQNRRYLVTAGYNTGPHNVAVAFVGQRDVARAIPMVNRMQPDRVYYHLIYNLPYGETRDYLRKVTQRMSLY